jgi:glutamate-1-semialdehyde 2,1-aminomutase
METLSPLGKVFHAGTLAGNPLATAAGRAALRELTPQAYDTLRARAARLSSVLGAACAAAGLPASFPVVGTLVGMFFGAGAVPVNFEQAKTTDERMYAAFFHAMLAEGVALAPGAYEALFVGLGHTDDVIDAIGAAAGRAALAAVAAVAG